MTVNGTLNVSLALGSLRKLGPNFSCISNQSLRKPALAIDQADIDGTMLLDGNSDYIAHANKSREKTNRFVSSLDLIKCPERIK